MPAAAGPHAIVLVVQEIFGVHEHIKDVCRRFAKQGYCAVAPELYARQGDVSKYTDYRDIMSNVVSKVPDAQVMSDLDATVRWADKHGGRCEARRCHRVLLGRTDRLAVRRAQQRSQGRRGVVRTARLARRTSCSPRYPIDVAAKLKAPVLGLYGGKDDGIPMADVEKMQAALAAAKSPVEDRGLPGRAARLQCRLPAELPAGGREGRLATVPRVVPEARRRLRTCSRTQRPQHGCKLFRERRVDAQPLLRDRMREFEPHTGQHQPAHAVEAREEAVVRPLP